MRGYLIASYAYRFALFERLRDHLNRCGLKSFRARALILWLITIQNV